jgi:hypothetical protein
MAIISKEQYWSAGHQFIKIVSYSPKNRRFYVDLPEWMAKAINTKKVSGLTQDEAERNFKNTCKSYEESVKKTKKIIAYKININGLVDEEKKDDFHFFGGKAIGIEYMILTETELEGKKNHINENGNYKNISDYKIIPWTLANQSFFERTERSLDELINKVDEFFKDENKLIQFIDSNKPLLINRE